MHSHVRLYTSSTQANISSHRRYIHTLYTRSSIEIIIFLPWWLLSHRKMMASSKCLLLPFALVVLLAEAQPPVTTPVFTENYGQAVSSKRCYVYSLFTQHCASVPCSAFRALTNVRTNIASSCSARACFWTIGWPPTRDYTPIHVHVRGWLASLSQCGSVPLEVAPKGEGNRREDLAGCEEDGRRGWRGRSSNERCARRSIIPLAHTHLCARVRVAC